AVEPKGPVVRELSETGIAFMPYDGEGLGGSPSSGRAANSPEAGGSCDHPSPSQAPGRMDHPQGAHSMACRCLSRLTTLVLLITTLIGAQPTDQRQPKRSYSTRFQLDEDPISEGGKWINGGNDGIDWFNVITKNGVAYGAVTQGAYTDPTSLL